MKINKIFTSNSISSLLIISSLVYYYFDCGKAFCLSIIEFYVNAFIIVVVTSFIISFYYQSLMDKTKGGILSVVFSPVAIWLTILILQPSNLNFKDAILMFYLYIAAIIGSVINSFVCFVRNKIK